MPRIQDSRAPGRVSTVRQLERQRAILGSAARLGAEHGLERVQMSEVAQSAGVALGTLYRYYPSKNHLFAAVLDGAIRDLPPPSAVPGDPVTGAGEFLGHAIGELLHRPRLARAMLVSMNAVRAEDHAPQPDPAGAGCTAALDTDRTMPERILAAAGITDPTDEDHRLARLLEQCVYGILTWTIAGRLTADQARSDTLRACELLLAPWRQSR
ncbi:TetR family transcriptional regulator [Nocardia seriolae]|uniref:HTH-type transcriptional repressor KstR n=1 Tax=Nocardia seriolae TaxID=37332 RepID=A0A0B8N1F8_9NOCA|nr:TetR family transcriptional regulator [Nocardia seriolae]APA99034.1 HTH-type transcriptional repressor KstR [Nocardia seriolae]MTJ63916.1 TetR family transcriptional regulator [Nocardia seriolae]MTJ71034.1 TetR family transcriptional regulator [Nocardia seriolae]MTJ88643.1 TetR family transcriptional regulator [Nocardia seriolae]MTK41807.1 TetR family transcriptional regulator [Nocardia seriolae]